MNEIISNAQKLFGLQLRPEQVNQLQIYERELLHWNARLNLTAIRDVPGIRNKHFLDSMSCTLAWGKNPPQTLIDVGTGAGFPGLVLKILYPQMRVVLVESVGKKADFCRHVIETLALKQIEVRNERAETLGQMPEFREKFDWAVARAVARMNVLVEYLLPLVRVSGHMLAQKGESGPSETQDAAQAIQILGGRLQRLIPLELPGIVEDRYLVIVDKVARTPTDYPRKPGVPKKKPLGS